MLSTDLGYGDIGVGKIHEKACDYGVYVLAGETDTCQ